MLLRRLPIRFVQTYVEQKQTEEMKKQKQGFKEMIENLSKMDSYTLRDYKKECISQDSKRGILRKMFTEAQPEEIQLEKAKKILNSMKDEELNSADKLSGVAKQEIAQITQTSIHDINSMLAQFKIQYKLHLYLKVRREKGDYIPQTQEELSIMMRTDRPPTTKEERFENERKFSNKQRRWLGGEGR